MPIDLVRIFRSLSDETRFRLLRLLHRHELTVNELAEITQLAQPRISNHLKILRDDELLVERREGSWRYYRVDADRFEAPLRAIWSSLDEAWSASTAFAADDKRLAQALAARAGSGGRSFFDELATRWDDIRESLFGDAIGRGILQSFLPPGLVVADIGTGTGYTLKLFAGKAARLIAIDNSEAMLASARQKLEASGHRNVDYRLSDVTISPLAANEVDVITLVQVLHHLPKPGDVLRDLAVGLRPGGMMIVSDFLEHDESWLRTDLQHRWSGFAETRIGAWLREAGLTVETWEVLPGRNYETPDGRRVRIPDGFTAVARKA